MKGVYIMGKKADYGLGHPNFIKYKKDIAENKAYEGMPDLYFENDEIQWEAPSNRKSGAFKDSHIKRKEWWIKKAISIGIDPKENFWISKTAKAIHPTKMKPCINCGEFMELRYCYPTKNLIGRFIKLAYIEDDFEFNPLEHILKLIERLHIRYGNRIFENFEGLFKCSSVKNIPSFTDINTALVWFDKEYIPNEPNMLSPGAMSNAPDRLDGFHTLNICCRNVKDLGRRPENLSSYSTDRRAFEYWVDGDWIAADRLMGLIRSAPKLNQIRCLNNHPGPCAADHIGPISLGFRHRPTFQLLCNACNSAKNNRMTFSDVQNLINSEDTGEIVSSWYASHLWNLRKFDVNDNETALRLSKMLRDNRHSAMLLLFNLYQGGHLVFLCTFLGLEYANRNVTFENIKVNNHIVNANLVFSERQQSYIIEQKIRRIRVGLQALDTYAKKENRNALLITNDEISAKIEEINSLLFDATNPDLQSIQLTLLNKLQNNTVTDYDLQQFLEILPPITEKPTNYLRSKGILVEIMQLVGNQLSAMWLDDRYVRMVATSLD